MWQLSFPYTEEAARSLCKDPTALKSEILRRCAKWHKPIPELLRSTPLDGMAGYPVYDREVLQPDVLRPGSVVATQAAAASTPAAQRRVTLIGDAAHPMTPFKAQGANQALSDAVLLADTLVESIQRHGPHAGLDAALPLTLTYPQAEPEPEPFPNPFLTLTRLGRGAPALRTDHAQSVVPGGARAWPNACLPWQCPSSAPAPPNTGLWAARHSLVRGGDTRPLGN